MFCKNCGKKINELNAKFCRICGTELSPIINKGNSKHQHSFSFLSIFRDFKNKGFVITLIIGLGILFIIIGFLYDKWVEQTKISARENEIIFNMEKTVRKIGEHIESISVTGSELPKGSRVSFYDRVYSNENIDMPYIVTLASEVVTLYENYIQEFRNNMHRFDRVADLVSTAFFFVKQEEIDRAIIEGNLTAISNIIERVDTFSNAPLFYDYLQRMRLLDELEECQSMFKHDQEFATDLSALKNIEVQINALSARAEYEYEANKRYNQLINTYNTKLKQVDRASVAVNSLETFQKKLALVDVELLIPSVDEIGITDNSGSLINN